MRGDLTTRPPQLEAALAQFINATRIVEPPRWLLRRIVAKLDIDCRFILAVEGVDLQRQTFGPFHYDLGAYGYMSWGQAREAARELLRLGVIEVDDDGLYCWTPIGERLLEFIPIRDAVLPDRRHLPGLPGTATQDRLTRISASGGL
jgi:hypothetical protein